MRNRDFSGLIVAVLLIALVPANGAFAGGPLEPPRLLEVPTIARYEVKYRFARLEWVTGRSFDEGRSYAISINEQLPRARTGRARLVGRLQEQNQLDTVVFDWFGTDTPKRLNLSIGSQVPVEIAQAAIEAYAVGARLPVFLQLADRDNGFDETHRIYIGGLVDFGTQPTPPETIRGLLKVGLTRQGLGKRLKAATIP